MPSASVSRVARSCRRRYTLLRRLSTIAAKAAAMTEAATTVTLAASSRSVPAPNASSPISRLRVKPIPASSDTPNRSVQDRSSSSSARVKRTIR
jgi:hypothetical protein